MSAMDATVAATEGRRIQIRGTVQGVGFRPWVYRLAQDAGVKGRVRNDESGVTIEGFGSREALDRFETGLRNSSPPAASIQSVRSERIPVEPAPGFLIVASETNGDRRVTIPPDLATCDACAAEIFDPHNRRYRYPFTNCTNCGPRFTIARDVPYDRDATTMAPFEMCEACRREYESPDDRRFHAEPNACPACGPHLAIVQPDGTVVASIDPIETAADALRRGLIVALKGIGGFHLACDATSEAATQRLRERKGRDEKPFAVMVRDLGGARRLAEVGPQEHALLESPERPIVLVPRRADAGVCAAVAPDNPLLGLLLPYSPLHHLLLAAVDRPLVMTSGNRSNEPLAWRNADAARRLGAIADLLLVHDRAIVAPCDDSVARVIRGRPVLLRRARGYVPRPLPLEPRVVSTVLACGALLKNTFCVTADGAAHLSAHVGDLEDYDTYRAYESAIARLERFLGVEPEIVAHDLHPDYLSTHYALERPERFKVAVQHHHAHVASAMAEHRLTGPVLGVAYDGAGHGTDGASWGSEILLATRRSFERVATFRAIPLAGGDSTTRQPWRIALALLDDALGDDAPLDALELFRGIPRGVVDRVRRVLRARAATPLASGMGRYFDGFGALGLAKPNATFEGQIALAWNLAADPFVADSFPYDVDDRTVPWTVDLRPAVREAVRQVIARTPAAAVSARFHNTVASATVDVVLRALRQFDRPPVVLTGGCFQNARLAEDIVARLAGSARVYTHVVVPPGDGGISLGQAVVADAVARR